MKGRKVIISAFILALISQFAMAQAQMDPTAPLPNDESVRYGVLDNGMTYYIKANQEPKERASFYIIQNVGALLEEDNQDGLAHFLEHMAFNGTKDFPKDERTRAGILCHHFRGRQTMDTVCCGQSG